jgi:septal ring factor EnvC (AmiA/AmiB activator)
MTTAIPDYSSEIDSISNDFSNVLDSFKTTFVNYYKNMDSTEDQNNFSFAKNNLKDKITEMYDLKEEMLKNISVMNDSINDLEEKINSSETEINKINDNYEAETNNGSKILVSDAIEKYKIQHVANITMFLGIVAMVGTFYSFTKNV